MVRWLPRVGGRRTLPERPHLLYSLSKSFTSTAAAFAIAEGLLDLDATVLSYFPELDTEITDQRSRSILVRHVAAMASGHLEETVERALALDPVEPVRGFLLIPPDREPGSVFAYNQPCTYTLAAIIQRLTGQTLIEYLRPVCSTRSASIKPAGSRTPLVAMSGTRDSTRRRTRSPGSGCCTSSAESGTVSGCCRRSGSPRPPGSRSKKPERAESGLAAGLRVSVLDGQTWIPRRRGVRAILRGASRSRTR